MPSSSGVQTCDTQAEKRLAHVCESHAWEAAHDHGLLSCLLLIGLPTWPAIRYLSCLGKPPQSERPVAGFAELTIDIGNDFLVSLQALSGLPDRTCGGVRSLGKSSIVSSTSWQTRPQQANPY